MGGEVNLLEKAVDFGLVLGNGAESDGQDEKCNEILQIQHLCNLCTILLIEN